MVASPLLHARQLFVEMEGERTPLAEPVDVLAEVGEVIAIRGPSGAGKSTLLRCLALLEARAVGELEHGGALLEHKAIPAFRRQVQYVPQSARRSSRTVQEQLALAFTYASAQTVFDLDEARTLIRELALPKGVLGQPLSELSGGELQRVALARALLTQPQIMLLDEPTSALDDDNRKRVLHLLERWLAQGERAAIVVTHDDAHLNRWVTRELTLAGHPS